MMISIILGGIQQNQARAQPAQKDQKNQKGTQRLNANSNMMQDPSSKINSAPLYGPHLPDEMMACIFSTILLESSMSYQLLLRAPLEALIYVKSTLNNKILKNTRIGWYGEDDDAENDTTSKIQTILSRGSEAQAILSRGSEAQAIYKNIGIGWYGEDDTAEEGTPPSSVNKLEETKMLILKNLSQRATMKTLNHQLRKIVGMHSMNRAAQASMPTTCMRSV